MRHAVSVLALAGTLVISAPAIADDSNLTAEELAAKFLAQQATRGLAIVPSDDQSASAGTTEGASLPEGVSYVALDPSTQVNIEIEFAFDSAALLPDQVAKLNSLCEVMLAPGFPQFKIIGHTDASGSESYNQSLSLLRAEEVKRHLVDDCGVPAEKLVAEGVGEAFPLNSEDPKADVNRRVEFQLGS